MRKFILTSLVLLSAVLPAFSVTKEEMEKARAVTAQIYLRWANNGSDYLEKLKPESLSDLESHLRDKEKTNIQAFKNIPVPADYASWDKEKVVEYWSVTAMQTSGLNPDGSSAGAKKRIRSRLNTLSFSAPQAEAPAEEAVEETPKAETTAPAAQPDEIVEAEAAMDALADSLAATDSMAPVESKKSNGSSTWIYIVALALLVIAVVVLVVYASKTMGRNNDDDDRQNQRPTDGGNENERPVRKNYTVSSESSYASSERAEAASAIVSQAESESSENARLREKFADTLAKKQDEIRLLNRRVNELSEDNRILSEQNTRLQSELDRLRMENEDMKFRNQQAPAPRQSPAAEREQLTRASGTQPAATATAGASREIYLGRVNSKGVFVRADRRFSPGNSIYLLRTSDGFSGTFRVVDDASVCDLVFPHPDEMLSGGCIAMDLTDTRGRQGIVTETAGTAIFENNCWRVIRKAKIRYE